MIILMYSPTPKTSSKSVLEIKIKEYKILNRKLRKMRKIWEKFMKNHEKIFFSIFRGAIHPTDVFYA